MKKFVLSFVVIVSFIGYSLYQRALGAQKMPIITAQNTSNSQSSQTVIQSSPTSASPTSQFSIQPTAAAVIPTSPPTSAPTVSSGYRDGTYTGDSIDAFYGFIKVETTITNGRITAIKFLQYPNDRDTSISINQQADPMLAQEAITAQSSKVDIISGATDSSEAFIRSLQSTLDQAKS